MKRHAYPTTVVSVNKHYKNTTKIVSLVQSGYHHQLNCSEHNIAEKPSVTQQSV